MKKLFTAIKKGDIDTVSELLEKNGDLVFSTAKQPPKSDDGQSTLQVALKTGNYEIANLLLDYGADVNFMESEDSENNWRIPVVQDAIRAAVLSVRTNEKDNGRYVKYGTKKEADESFEVLKRIVELGADLSKKDSYDNTALDRAILDACQVLPTFHFTEKRILNDRKMTDELREDLSRIFNLLFEYGADRNQVEKNSNKPILEYYELYPVYEFIKK